MTRILLQALPQVHLPGGMFVHNCGLGGQPALEHGAEKLLLAFEMAEKGNFVDAGTSSDLARRSTLNTVPGEGLGRGIQESLARLIGGRRDEPLTNDLRGGRLHASTYLHHWQKQAITCIFVVA